MYGQNILLVEDEAIVAQDLRQCLERDGFRVNAVARSGPDAIRLAEEKLPDLVLMDIKLDGKMSGVEAAIRIQAQRPVPVVYLTGYPSVFLSSPARNHFPNLCLLKPFQFSQLKSVLEAALVLP